MKIMKQALILVLVTSGGTVAFVPSFTFVQSTPSSSFSKVAILHGSYHVTHLTVIKKCDSLLHRNMLPIENEDEDEFEDDEEGEGPLAKGIDSVGWLPSLQNQQSPLPDFSKPSSDKYKAEVLPLFPLGGTVYTPNSKHVLNIFEPRYRQMYNDILMNGSKRFVVSMSHPTQEGTFAKVGVVFELQELKEVSEQTGDQIKYICNHDVTGRVKLHRILNPEVWKTRETYLKVEGSIIDESKEDSKNLGEEEKTTGKNFRMGGDIYSALAGVVSGNSDKKHEESLRKSFRALVDKQHELQETVRFTRASVQTLAVAPGNGDDGLWMTIRLWQSFVEQRLVARQNEMQKGFQEKLLEFLKKEKGLSEKELPGAIGFNDLSPSLKQELQELQRRMTFELQPLILESTLSIQKILEAKNHKSRLSLLRAFIDAEASRLDAKRTLKGVFTEASSTAWSKKDDELNVKAVKEEENLEENRDKQDAEDKSSPKGSIFQDEPDAFQ